MNVLFGWVMNYLQERGAVVNTAIVLEVAQGIVRNHNIKLLK